MINPKTGIYEIVNTINGHRYIGQAVDAPRRWREHRSLLGRGKSPSIILQRAWNKYGEGTFEFNVLIICEPFELTRYEQSLVDKRDPEYNVCRECVNSSLGLVRTLETRAKIGASKKGRPGAQWSAESRAKMSMLRKGKPLSIEHRMKLSAAHKGVPLSPEHRASLSKSNGSLEHRARLSESLRGRPAWNKGIPHSLATRNKIRLARWGKE